MSMHDHSRNRRWLLRALATTFGTGVAVVTGLPGPPRARAVCVNLAVLEQCKINGSVQLNACAFDDWICKCNANVAIQNCYLQCADDPIVQAEARAHEPIVQLSCSLAA